MALQPLHIGDLTIDPPIIQGGMGVRVSGAHLAAAVANEGCVGVIASVGLGDFENNPGSRFTGLNEMALRQQIREARSLSDGIIGVNVMVALSDYAGLIRAAVDEKVDVIISGAGLPIDLPKLAEGSKAKLLPIVSSGRALKIICSKWWKSHKRLPDAVVLEGYRAGGHLGFKRDDLDRNETKSVQELIPEVLDVADSFDRPIPLIAAGGIFDGRDIAEALSLGAAGVQMGTRFVCTDECDVDHKFKQAYLDAAEEDVVVIDSPVGMPARVIKNAFVEKILAGATVPFKCEYRCLRTCDPSQAPYCIAKVLANAAKGNLAEAFAFAGSNASRCKEIVSVKALIERLAQELRAAMAPQVAPPVPA